jgi:hypothetical protein
MSTFFVAACDIDGVLAQVRYVADARENAALSQRASARRFGLRSRIFARAGESGEFRR